ncbi:MAG TPA: lipocalin family protein [Terriglobales bacterium]
MKVRMIALLGGALLAGVAVRQAFAVETDIKTVPTVDLQRYVGRWYEVARYPNRFEKKCDRNITAEYSIRSDGKISVVNSCTERDGNRNVARGWAKVADRNTNAKLRVTFFWPFFGDYWIVDLGRDYEYAVVSEPGRKYLWILSRTPQMSAAQFGDITQRLRDGGFDTSKLIRVQNSSD